MIDALRFCLGSVPIEEEGHARVAIQKRAQAEARVPAKREALPISPSLWSVAPASDNRTATNKHASLFHCP